MDSRFPCLGITPQMFSVHTFKDDGAMEAWEKGVNRELLKIYGRRRSDAIDSYLQATGMKLRITGWCLELLEYGILPHIEVEMLCSALCCSCSLVLAQFCHWH